MENNTLLKLLFFLLATLLFLFFLYLLLFLVSAPTTVSASIIRVTHSSPPQRTHPEPITSAAAVSDDLRFDDAVLRLSIPNGLLQPLASNRTLAVHWLRDHVLPLHPRSKTATISVGNDAVPVSVSQLQFLLPAIRNLNLALGDIGIKQISVSTTFTFVNTDRDIRPLLQFLEDANSSFLIRKDIKIHEFVESDHNLQREARNLQQEADQLDRSPAIRNSVIALRILCLIILLSFLFLRLPDMPYARNFTQVILLWNYAYAVFRSWLVLRETLHEARVLLERDLQLGALSLSFVFTMLFAVMAAGTIVYAVAVAPKLVSRLVWKID